MKKALLCVLMASLIGGASWVSATGTMDAVYLPVGTLTLSPPRGAIPSRSAVAFPHSLHFNYTCRRCHHTWDGFTAVKSCTTSGCHDRGAIPNSKEGKIASSTLTMRYFREAYHQNCITCHKRLEAKRRQLENSGKILKKSLPKTGPTGCIGCHPKTP